MLPSEITKPDYDMSVFYVDKGPSIKPKIGGYTISNTGGVDSVADPSKKMAPGVGHYEDRHAYERTTFHKPGPKYSVPQEGHFSIQQILASYSSVNSLKKEQKKNQLMKQ